MNDTGTLDFAAGNPTINGAIFIDGPAEDISQFKGNATITYDSSQVEDAFGYNPLPFVRASWREIYK